MEGKFVFSKRQGLGISYSINGPARFPRVILSRFLVLVGVTCAWAIILLVWPSYVTMQRNVYPLRRLQEMGCKNTTLGFEQIAVVSSKDSWRVRGLIEAADYTGIGVKVVGQPSWSTFEVDVFRGVNISRKSGRKSLGPGQARCWLGHLNVLRDMIQSGSATSLIMEDDVDWDIAIKTQLSLVAPLIRAVTNASHGFAANESPFGDKWDLLWLGHCGDLAPRKDTNVISIIDETLPDSPLYRQVYGDYTFHPPLLRMVYPSISPVCTFAYAVTLEAARKIYYRAFGGRDRIITVDLREWCRDGVLRCVTVNPELFHHHKAAGEISSEIAAVEGWKEGSAPAPVGYTANIKYSARCNSHSETLTTCQDERQ